MSGFDSREELAALWERLKLPPFGQGDLEARSPIDGQVIGHVRSATSDEVT